MNTPAHVVASALLLGRGRWRPLAAPIVLGALLPDLPMVGFYGFQKWIALAPERQIWSELYFEPQWQRLFDGFHSLPLVALAALAAWRLGATAALALLASMALHSLCDLPLHREDAHRHFFPLADWRFVSPVSYWDPAHHGRALAVGELAFAIAGSVALLRRSERSWRFVAAAVLALYAGFLAFALSFWAEMAHSPT
jgi:hypothetical protein